MLELMVFRDLNKYRGKPIENFRQKVRPISANELKKQISLVSASRFDIIWTNYHLQMPQTTVVELDVLASGEDAKNCWALVFEVKNRQEAHPPSQIEAQSFIGKVERVKQWLAQKEKEILFVCPVYLSAKGFQSEVEVWMQEHGILTADLAFLGLESLDF